ncbi:MAG: dihydrolipoamide succinyltransferase, partial [Gammaproteobacteria bacterium]|nr:dihydrolipoamide succinyltransferase [Gammaproteobacteria bacterium]NIR90004.1 dihydrolipoamide succinyltransferase [Gammaproteobacteria bacterium]
MRVPELPESVTEATVAAWNKGVGDRVRRDENVVEIETDKVVFEVPAPRDGMLQQVYKQAGEDVTSGETLATLIPGEAPAA